MDLETRQILDALPQAVVTAFADGRADFLNHRWCEYTGIQLHRAAVMLEGLGRQGDRRLNAPAGLSTLASKAQAPKM